MVELRPGLALRTTKSFVSINDLFRSVAHMLEYCSANSQGVHASRSCMKRLILPWIISRQ